MDKFQCAQAQEVFLIFAAKNINAELPYILNFVQKQKNVRIDSAEKRKRGFDFKRDL